MENIFPGLHESLNFLKSMQTWTKKNLFMIKKLISGISHTPELFGFWKCDDLYYLLIV